MRLIDADTMNRYVDTSLHCYYSDHCTVDDVKYYIDEQPTVDAELVRHAHWIECKEYVYRKNDERLRTTYICSLCERTERVREPYCNCGAKMDG